jgi:hypothetical protein
MNSSIASFRSGGSLQNNEMMRGKRDSMDGRMHPREIYRKDTPIEESDSDLNNESPDNNKKGNIFQHKRKDNMSGI